MAKTHGAPKTLIPGWGLIDTHPLRFSNWFIFYCAASNHFWNHHIPRLLWCSLVVYGGDHFSGCFLFRFFKLCCWFFPQDQFDFIQQKIDIILPDVLLYFIFLKIWENCGGWMYLLMFIHRQWNPSISCCQVANAVASLIPLTKFPSTLFSWYMNNHSSNEGVNCFLV